MTPEAITRAASLLAAQTPLVVPATPPAATVPQAEPTTKPVGAAPAPQEGGLETSSSPRCNSAARPRMVVRPSFAASASRTTTGPQTGGNRTCTADLAGNRTPRAPEFTLSANDTYTLPPSVGESSANVSLNHNSGFFWEPDNRYAQPTYNLLNAPSGWRMNDGGYEVRVFARNILDEYDYGYFTEASGRLAGTPEMPRDDGLSVEARF